MEFTYTYTQQNTICGQHGNVLVRNRLGLRKRDQWETDLFFGFIPKHDSHRAKMTMTLKQNYMPWSLELGKGFSTEPLACGIYLTLFSDTNSGYTSLAVIRKDTTDSRPRYAHTSFWDNG